jgi:hypothetical protein
MLNVLHARREMIRCATRGAGRELITGAGNQSHARAIATRQNADAVVFDLVHQPSPDGGRLVGEGWQGAIKARERNITSAGIAVGRCRARPRASIGTPASRAQALADASVNVVLVSAFGYMNGPAGPLFTRHVTPERASRAQ